VDHDEAAVCASLLAVTSIYVTFDTTNELAATKVAECKIGEIQPCSCMFETRQFGVFVLVDDKSTIDLSPSPPIPATPPATNFTFDNSHIPLVPEWTWYPSIPPVPIVPPVDPWGDMDPAIKIGIGVTMGLAVIIYSIYRYWWYTTFEVIVGPTSGAQIKVGGDDDVDFGKLIEVHLSPLWEDNSESKRIKSAQESFRLQNEARELSKLRDARKAERVALKNRARQLECAGPILIEPHAPKSFMLEMYKPQDKDRVYARKPGQGKKQDTDY